MDKTKTKIETRKKKENIYFFGKKNYKFLFIGLGLIIAGFILMIGGGSDDPNVFNPEMFNFRRLTLAPILIASGYIIEIYAIMTLPKEQSDNDK